MKTWFGADRKDIVLCPDRTYKRILKINRLFNFRLSLAITVIRYVNPQYQ